jgi:hypothetical protein
MPIIYNACYGGFTIPEDVERELAAGPTFSTLFPEVLPTFMNGLEIIEQHPYIAGFQQIKGRYGENGRVSMKPIITDGVKYYYIGSDAWRQNWKAWHSAPEVVAACRRAGLIGVKRGETLLEIKYIPIGSQFAIESRDGREMVRVIPPYVEVIEDLLGILKGGARDADSLHPLTVKLLAGDIAAVSLCY